MLEECPKCKRLIYSAPTVIESGKRYGWWCRQCGHRWLVDGDGKPVEEERHAEAETGDV